MTIDAQPADFAVNFQPFDVAGANRAERVMWAPKAANTLIMALPDAPRGLRIFGVNAQGSSTVAALSSREDWDVGVTHAGQAQFVHTESGSAVVALAWQALPDGKPKKVNQHLAFGVFEQPRYVRGTQGSHAPQGSPLPLTSVASLGSPQQAKAIVFLPDADGGYQKHRVLPVPAGGRVLGVLLLEVAQGYLMVTRLADVEAPRRGENAGGHLLAQQLSDKFKPVGQAWRPFGDRPVYEFDAGMADARLVLFATTQKGWAMAIGSRVRTGETGALSSPTLAVDKDVIRVAVMTADGKERRLMSARVGLPP